MKIKCATLVLLLAACATTKTTPRTELKRSLLRELVSRGDWNAASNLARELVLESPNDPTLRVYRGIVYREQGHLQAALSDLTEAVKLNDKEPLAHSALAVTYNMMRRHDEALTHHRRASELVKDSSAYFNNLGFGLYLAGKSEDAIKALETALRLDPTDMRTHNNLGFAYARRGDLTHAASEFDRGGNASEAKNNLGLAYEMDGNLAMAKSMYVAALSLDPSLEEAKANLAHVESKLGGSP